MKKTLRRTILAVAMLVAAGGQLAAQLVETTYYDDGSVYTGTRNGKGARHGDGLMVWPTGDRYDGQWNKGVIEGTGTYQWGNGSSYSGQWRKGEIKGHGIFRWPNGDMMEGDWKDGSRTGTGFFQWADGTRYEGPGHRLRHQNLGQRRPLRGPVRPVAPLGSRHHYLRRRHYLHWLLA